jgi:hypothetical protein
MVSEGVWQRGVNVVMNVAECCKHKLFLVEVFKKNCPGSVNFTQSSPYAIKERSTV